MHKYLSTSLNGLNSVVSIDVETAWCAQSLQEIIQQRNNNFGAKFQQKQMEEKEEKLLRLYESQQQRAIERVGRGSAGSNTSIGSTGGGKVRQMFDERRQKAGIDRSYPLQPLKSSKINNNTNVYDKNSNNKQLISYSTTSNSYEKNNISSSSTNTKIINTRSVKNVQQPRNSIGSVRNKVDTTMKKDMKMQSIIPGKLYDEIDRSSSHELIEMMNNHNVNDLDDEEIPSLAYSDVVSVNEGETAKGEKVRSKAVESHMNGTITNGNSDKPLVRRSVITTSNTPGKAREKSQSYNSPPATFKSASDMIANTKSVPKSTPSTKSSPSAGRPSAKQSAKGPVVRDDLDECKYCGRRFASDRIGVHESICAKAGKKRRKAYDATRHRVQGTELEPYVKGKGPKPPSTKASSTKGAPKKDWRRAHEEFVASIRAAKQMQAHLAKGGKLSDLPPPVPSTNPDYVQCPHCGRRFNESAAERHIPKCANYAFNKAKPSNSGVKGKPASRK